MDKRKYNMIENIDINDTDIKYHIKYTSKEGEFEIDMVSTYKIPKKDIKYLEAYIGGWQLKTNVKIISCIEIEKKYNVI